MHHDCAAKGLRRRRQRRAKVKRLMDRFKRAAGTEEKRTLVEKMIKASPWRSDELRKLLVKS